MLKSLSIQNFVLVEKLELDFTDRICVITGETGAGKSLIIDSIENIIGGRSNNDQIGNKGKYSYLEGTFISNKRTNSILKENGFDDIENEIVISKKIQKSGSKYRLNGQLVTQGLIKKISTHLIDVISQHDNQFILKPENHIKVLDSLGNKKHKDLLDNLKKTFNELKDLKNDYQKIKLESSENSKLLDFWNFQLNEIEEADLQLNEEEELKNQREVLVHAEDLIKDLNEAYFKLYETEDFPSICDQLDSVSKMIEHASRFDKSLESLSEELESINLQLKDVSISIRDHSENVESDPETLEEVEDRLNLIAKMKLKYGSDINEIIVYQESLAEKVNNVNNSSNNLESLEKNILLLTSEYNKISENISESRLIIAKKLKKDIENELKDLGMEKTEFIAKIDFDLANISDIGSDNVKFLISPNPGEPLRPLEKTVSGGESSRLMLALKMILHKPNPISTMIFDEIDTGISGKTALIVSHKLAKLSQISQIICITHLPVVAAMADQHLWIEKESTDIDTIVNVKELTTKLRFEKLAQIGAGNINSNSIKHANDLYNSAINYKEKIKL